MKFLLSSLAFVVLVFSAQAQTAWLYDGKETNKDNLGIYTIAAINTTAGLHSVASGSSPTVKGAASITTAIGCFYQKGIGSRLSLRFGFSIGKVNNAFRYAQKYDSLTEDFRPMLSSRFSNYHRVNNRIAYAMPQIDLGYIFGPFNKLYLLECRAGVGLQAYLSESSDTIVVSEAAVVRNGRTNRSFDYATQYASNYGKDGLFGTVVANVYVGMRWQKTTSAFLNHFALGIHSTIPFGISNSGYTDVVYFGAQNKQVFTLEKVNLSMLCFGLKATYNFL